RDLKYLHEEGVFVPYYRVPDSEKPTKGAVWDPYFGWQIPNEDEAELLEKIEAGIIDEDQWKLLGFQAGTVPTDVSVALLKSSAANQSDLQMLKVAGRFSKVLGPLGAVPGVVVDINQGRSLLYTAGNATTSLMAGTGVTAL